ncbi:MAG: 30S ribosomal protein S17 [Candidatus Thermoplasmatota archaeon]|jgi:small subunit ribosomal protein S17|nr:30S ribosomal protein S17 [Candidatus Thermoplasmatota archaeon]MCL5984005.1 30S ribosomal protein S17 [Candidatus Thermoplasmatota archaeon]
MKSEAAQGKSRDPGLDVRLPKESCSDPKCPFHGHIKVRGQVIEGVVVSTKMQGTVVVERTLLHYVPKYERYEKRKSRYMVHSPPCLKVSEGKRVRLAETRPIAKNVSFVIVENLGDVTVHVRGEEEVKE